MLRKISLVIVLLNLLLLWVDVFTFSGFLQLHLGIPMKIILTFSVVISTLIYLIPQPTHKFSHKLVIPTIILILLYLLIVTIEGITSPGYIFSNLHLRPEAIFYPVLAMSIFTLSTNLVVKETTSIRLTTYFLVIALCYYLLRQLPIILIQSSILIKTMVMAPTASYDDKMRSAWGDFYDYMVYLKQNLPAEGTVLGIPPQRSPWYLYGNGMLVQYFVYPTTVGNIDFDTNPSTLPPYLMQLSDWPPNNPLNVNDKWGLIKL